MRNDLIKRCDDADAKKNVYEILADVYHDTRDQFKRVVEAFKNHDPEKMRLFNSLENGQEQVYEGPNH